MVTAKTLTVSATGVNIIDGTMAATVTLSDDRLAGDNLTDGLRYSNRPECRHRR